MDLVNEVKLGCAKGTELEEAVENNFKGETTEVGLYLAMAHQAQREGYPEIAEVLKTIAWEEAEHAAHFAELNGKIGSTEENLKQMLSGEQSANKGKRESALKAKEIINDHCHDFFDESSRDEARHAQALEGLMKHYFGGEK